MSKNEPQTLGHGDECDGIEEYDNALPMWWQGILYFTIIFAGVYTVRYHFLQKDSQAARYDAEVAAAAEQWPEVEVVVSEITPEMVAAGKEIYDANCVACHAADMTGGIGPNLTDSEWIHGGSMEEIMKTIDEGVPEKGMLTWGPILGAEKVAQVAAYVHEEGGGQ